MDLTAEQLIRNIERLIIVPIIKFLFALALFLFVFGIVEFMYGADNEEKIKRGKEHMLWGVIGMFVMISAGGIMWIICDTIGCQ